MINLVSVIIFPVLIAITIFLFNIGTKEIVDGKSGFNNKYIKSMAYVIISIFLLAGFLILNDFPEKIGNGFEFILIVLLLPIYLLSFYCFGRKRDKVFMSTDDYSPSSWKSTMLAVFLVFFTIITSILIFTNISRFFSQETLIKSVEIENMTIGFLIGMLGIIIIPYGLMVLTTGYLYSYSRLFGFIKQELVLSKEGKEILNSIYNKTDYHELNFEVLEAYIFVESDEYSTLKINNIKSPSVRIKNKYILARKFIPKSKL